jgi:hypothetical protein
MHKKPKTESTSATMSDRYANQNSGGKNLSGCHGRPFTDSRGPYYDGHRPPYNERRGHHGPHRQHGQRGRNYYQPYPRQSESDTARKIAKVQQALPSKERKEEVVKKLLQGVMTDAERARDEVVEDYVDDEENEVELRMYYDYPITVKHSNVLREEMKLKELIKELPKCNQLTDAFEANAEQVVKCYCPACPDNCEFENSGKMIAHLREKTSKKRGCNENYWEHDNSHELVLAYIQELFPKYKKYKKG